jgi:uncharacterized membrane protein YhaH (DUF805 family)
MDFKTSIQTCISKYITFSGRARRSEYWWFVLATILVSVVLTGVDMIIGLPLSILFSLAVLVPSIAVATRRLHDINKSGWWQLIVFVPLVGAIVLIFWLVKEGSTTENRFGAAAKTTSEFSDAE